MGEPTSTVPTRICVLGLGEAGAAIAGDLAAQDAVEVHGYDPVVAVADTPAGVERHPDVRGAVGGAELVLAITPAADATTALVQTLDSIPGSAVYADLSTSAPRLKQRLAGLAAAAGLGFVDVALMSPVPGGGLRTPALASGPAAGSFAATMRPLGMPVEVVGDEPGRAAAAKLLRSVLMKGLAAVLIESLRAAEAAGLAAETWENLVSQLGAIDEAMVRRLVTGPGTHARRRLHEMEAAVDLLTEVGVDPLMTRSTVAHLRRLVDDPDDLPGLPG
jgi:3-hydroxyisobutyrate dehydrogenase-like beta-hydroxyacid dehydrogenase